MDLRSGRTEYAVMIQTVQVESKKRNIKENEEDTDQTVAVLQGAKDELDRRNKDSN